MRLRHKPPLLIPACALGGVLSVCRSAHAADGWEIGLAPSVLGCLLFGLAAAGLAWGCLRGMRRAVARLEAENREMERVNRLTMDREARILALKEDVRRLNSLLDAPGAGRCADPPPEYRHGRSEAAASGHGPSGHDALLSLLEDVEQARQELERRNELLAFQVREAEATEAAAQGRERLLWDFGPMGVIRLDANGRVERANPAALLLLGYQADELLGVYLHEAVHVLHADGTPMPYADCPVYQVYVRGQAAPLREQMFLRKDGGAFCVDGLIAPIVEGEAVAGAIVFFQDVTECKTLAAQGGAAWAGPTAMCLVTDNVIRRMNPPMAALTGLREGDSFSRIFTRDADRRALDAHLLGHRDMAGFALTIGGPDQSLRPVLLSALVLDSDYCSGMVYWLEDAGPLRGCERDLALARDAAATRDSLLARLSHAIRTPMNAVAGMEYLLRQSGLTAQQTDHADKLRNAADELVSVIDNVLGYALLRSEQAEQAGRPAAPFSLAAVAEEALGGWREKALRHGLGWSFAVSPDVPDMLAGDAVRLGRILACLAGRAVGVTASGDIAVSIGRDAAPEPFPPGRVWLRLLVRDSGPDLTPELAEAVSRPCPRAGEAAAFRDETMPLELIIAQGLAASLGGRVWANLPDRGGELYCLVPVLEAGLGDAAPEGGRPTESATEPALEEPMQTGEEARPEALPRVLLAEDNEINQEIASELLRDLRVEVTVAENGARAVEAVNAGRYDLIFMDIQMPVMDGLEATRRIRASGLPWAEQVPIIAMTAHGLSDDRERSLAAGMNAHLTKPIDPQALSRLLAAWLPQRQSAAAPGAPSTPGAPDSAARPKEMQQLYGINTTAGIANVAGNEKLYFDLLRRFAAKYRDSQHELPALLERGDVESASRLAHTIKGVAANLGAVHLADMVKKIETALLAGEPIVHLLSPYARELGRVTQGVEHLTMDSEADTARPDDGRTVGVDAASVPGILDVLAGLPQLMQTDWGQAQEHVEALAPLLEHTRAAPEYARLRNALEEFDLDAFGATAESLAQLLR